VFNSPFYHSAIRKAVIGFGTLFNKIYINRTNSAGDVLKTILVPVSYGPREKYLVRQKDDPDLNRPVDIILPRMSFQMTSFEYYGENKLNTMGKQFKDIPNINYKLLKQFNPVAYKVGFELSVMVKNTDDGNQIIEQILPFFTPDYTITINSIPELDLVDKMPVVLTSVALADNYDDDWAERRNIVWTLNFWAYVNFYGPITDQPVITQSSVDVVIPQAGANTDNPAEYNVLPRVQRYTAVPDPIDADPSSDFGYTETFEEFSDGKHYDIPTGDDVE
jgi:T4-like virus Myoviridae tail sheath stabiliser